MRFDDLDNADPLYSPGLTFSGKTARWKAPKRYVDAGWRPASISLGMPGHKDDEHALVRAKLCRQHTRELLAWWEKTTALPAFGTWGYLIHRYRADAYSPYADVKENTRENYDWLLEKWKAAIGKSKITDMTYVQVRTIERAMRDKGRSRSYIKRMFTMLRGLASYGCMIPETQAMCRDVRIILSDIRFKTPPQKSVAPTRAEVEALVAAADELGYPLLGTGMTFQFELCLRMFDVFGQWVKGEGGIERNGRKWIDGLTWDMISPDCTKLTKVIAKTEASLPEPYTWDLAPLPHLVDRLRQSRNERAVGPVFVSDRFGVPYTQYALSAAFRRCRTHAGVNPAITLRDLRAGGVTEAKIMGVPISLRRDAAGHVQEGTTDRYSRARSESANTVIQLRQQGRSANTGSEG